MAISPPSDILLDVANAADPAKVRLAQARLAKLAAEPPGGADAEFGKALATATTAGRTTALAAAAPLHPTIGKEGTSRPAAKTAAEAYQKFEALLLQNFVESMLPKDDELYGDKTSAGVYRSMMAEQFATQLSKAGGIGIAKAVAGKHPATTHAAGLTPDVNA